MGSIDARVDAGRASARGRAAAMFGTPALRQQLAPRGRDPEFDIWKAHRAVVIPVILTYSGEGPPPDTLDSAYRVVTVGGTAVGEDGWRVPITPITVFCTLTGSIAAGWRVSAIDAQ